MDTVRIERDVLINATAERVWSTLIQFRWVDAGDPSRFKVAEGTMFVAESGAYGDFPILVERVEPPRRLSYRWASAFAGEKPVAGNSTLVEFTLTEESGGTRLAVVESGFEALPEDARARAYRDNTDGWSTQLEALADEVA